MTTIYLSEHLDAFMDGLWEAGEGGVVVLHLEPYKLGPRVLQELLQVFLPVSRELKTYTQTHSQTPRLLAGGRYLLTASCLVAGS